MAGTPPGGAPTPVAGERHADHPPDPLLLLDNQICFLVYRLHRALNDLYRPMLADLGLTYPQYLVMLVLWETEPISLGRLGARLHLESGTLSPLVKRLEAHGYVTRVRSDDDERVVHVGLTEAGWELRQRARDVPGRVGACLSGTAEEYWRVRQQLTELLGRVQ